MGLRGLRNAFRHFGMLPGNIEGEDEPVVWINDAEMVEAPAPAAGVFVPAGREPADWIEEGESLGHMFTVDRLDTIEVRAPVSGYVYEIGPVHEKGEEHTRPFMHPYAAEGQAAAIVAVAADG